jgi:hypothetical protein
MNTIGQGKRGATPKTPTRIPVFIPEQSKVI